MLLALRLIIAVVFGLAGITKFLDLTGTRNGLTEFGLPKTLSTTVAVILPVVEVATSVSLMDPRSAAGGAAFALFLLFGFSVAIVVNLTRGRKAACHCFGTLYSRPIGLATLVRNICLAGCVGLILGTGPASAGRVVWSFSPLAAALFCTALSCGAWVYIRFGVPCFERRLLSILETKEPRKTQYRDGSLSSLEVPQAHLRIGAMAPDFESRMTSGESITLSDLHRNRTPLILIFTDPHCQTCSAMLPEIRQWQREYEAAVRIVVIRSAEANDDGGRENVKDVVLQSEREIMDAYRIGGIPAAIVVRPDGHIGSSVAVGPKMISMLVEDVTRASPRPA